MYIDTRLTLSRSIRDANQLCRDAGDGLSELCCTVHIDVGVRSLGIPYKYVMYSQRGEENEKSYEFIHRADGHGEIVNRCLLIPATIVPGGMHTCMKQT